MSDGSISPEPGFWGQVSRRCVGGLVPSHGPDPAHGAARHVPHTRGAADRSQACDPRKPSTKKPVNRPKNIVNRSRKFYDPKASPLRGESSTLRAVAPFAFHHLPDPGAGRRLRRKSAACILGELERRSPDGPLARRHFHGRRVTLYRRTGRLVGSARLHKYFLVAYLTPSRTAGSRPKSPWSTKRPAGGMIGAVTAGHAGAYSSRPPRPKPGAGGGQAERPL